MPYGVVARRPVPLRGYADLRPLVIAVVRGHIVTPAFESDAGLRKDLVPDYRKGIEMTFRARTDAVAGAIPTILHLAREQGFADRIGDVLVLSTRPNYLKCSRRSPNLAQMDELNAAIRAMRADGSLAGVLNRYGYALAPAE
jgi:polar amino acid transport system substrate-binding protein